MFRLPDFCVEHSNLNSSSISKRKGKKRYFHQKNSNSDDFTLVRPSMLPKVGQTPEVTQTSTVYLLKIKEILEKKSDQLKFLKIASQNVKNLEEIRKHTSSHQNSPVLRKDIGFIREYDSSELKLLGYRSNANTKNYTKIFDSNPIIGYPTRNILSPDRKKVYYGNMILNNSFR